MKKKSILGFMDGEAKIVGNIEASWIELEPEIKIRHRGAWEKRELDDLFILADQLVDAGRDREAFRMMKIGAEAGDRSMQLNVGYLYDTGRGVRRNRERAMYWYKRAYGQGDASAANNIGTIYRDEKRWALALKWFRRAVSMNDDDPNYEIAKISLANGKPAADGRRHLKRVIEARTASENSQEQAAALLETLKRMPKKRHSAYGLTSILASHTPEACP